ncbi:FAD:protein FMN transferase [Thermomonas sp.]|uniref:FAD:protein FMN transferase n=1 Tax=Thermomonas sp. TaxID=1971895 RepID=UPI002639F346|nr:FAD:protein FMN transferase [Thermomonas sp.]
MSKMSIELVRHVLNGPTMGTRWSAVFHARPMLDVQALRAALQEAVDAVDAQMSTWRADSALMQLNRAPVGTRVVVPNPLFQVLELGLSIGRRSLGAFDIGIGDAVDAWGFGPNAASERHIQTVMAAIRKPACEALELGSSTACKRAPITIDLNGIAKGYGVDELVRVLTGFGVVSGLVGVDGEMRALGPRPDGEPWAIAVESPVVGSRSIHSVLELEQGAVATSGDYRHCVTVNGRRLSHTMDPWRGLPLASSPASVTVLAPTCAEADAWATALMVLGPEDGLDLAIRQGLSALFLMRSDDGKLASFSCGHFDEPPLLESTGRTNRS